MSRAPPKWGGLLHAAVVGRVLLLGILTSAACSGAFDWEELADQA